MPEGWRPRGVTRHPRSGAAAESTRLQWCSNGREELPHVRGWGAAERNYPASKVRGGDKRSYPLSEVRGHDERSYPVSEVRGGNERSYPRSEIRGRDERSYIMSEVRGGSLEEIPHAPSLRPGAAAWRSNPTPEDRGSGREEQLHVQGAMAVQAQGGPRGAIPR